MSQLTPAQQAAIEARGNVLVVAGAGTGKTRTLVDRCVALLEGGESLEHLLLVTFTDAAAAEMRQRIREVLLERLARDQDRRGRPEPEHWEHQLAVLDTAWISTLHSLCLELVRRHFHDLAIDPEISVLDEAQTRPLLRATLDALFERHCLEGAPTFATVQNLIRRHGDGSDAGLRRLLQQIHRYTQTLPDPEGWMARQRERFARADPAFWRETLVGAVRDWRALWRPDLAEFAGTPNVAACLQALEGLPAEATPNDCAALLRKVQGARAGPWPHGSVGKVRDLIADFFDEAEFLCSQAEDDAQGLADEWAAVREHMSALLELARELTADFSRAKRALGGVDFADLEQFSLRLLWDTPGGDPSAIARRWRDQFHFVFVDEYQDINPAQEAILRALSREGAEANRFLVGDVKQSIYRFRLANPRIFADYERRWRNHPREGRCLDLADNFRSREALLDFVNSLFASLLRASVGGVDYGSGAALHFGDPAGRAALSRRAGSGPRVELHLLSKPAKETPGEPGLAGSAEPMDELAVEREARLVARRLRQLRDAGHTVWDQAEGRLRPAGWRDMAVLLRSPAGRGEGYAKEFHAAGVPLVAERGGFYRALEVSDLLSLLKLLGNPQQDFPLLAVLRSPLVGLSLDELASVRVHNPERPFWAALRRFHRETPDRPAGPATGLAWSKIDGFLNAFTRWREQVRQSSLSHGLEAVLLETQYEPLLLAEPRGPERVANVRRLIDLTRQYDPYQRQGLHRFLRFIALQEEEELDLEPATLPGEDAVRLLSIHRSKGLEFPVVVLAGLGSRFNLQDTHAAVLLHQEHGLCPKVLTADGNARYPTLAHWLASRSEKRERLGEELRLLYVAMTRARDTLLLVGTAHRKDDARRWRSEPARPLRDREVTSARCSLDWLRLWLPQITAESDWISETEGRGPLLQWGIHGADDPLLDPEDPSGGATPDPSAVPPAVPAASWAALKLRMEWRYPFAAATSERAKASVSALRQSARGELEDEARLLRPFEPERRRQRRDVEAGGLSSAEVGNAHHRFLQWLSLGATADADPLRREAQRLRQEGRLTPAEVEALDLEGLAAFWNSEVGRRIRDRADCVQRELPFTARFSPGELARVGVPAQTELPDEEFVVVQGVADLVVILPQEVWILDFKTDDIRRSGLEERAALYRPQLALYALALERIHRRPVRERWLHFIRLRETVRV